MILTNSWKDEVRFILNETMKFTQEEADTRITQYLLKGLEFVLKNLPTRNKPWLGALLANSTKQLRKN